MADFSAISSFHCTERKLLERMDYPPPSLICPQANKRSLCKKGIRVELSSKWSYLMYGVVDVEGLVCVGSWVGEEGGDVTSPLVPGAVVVVRHHRHEVRVLRQGGDVVGPVIKRGVLNYPLCL